MSVREECSHDLDHMLLERRALLAAPGTAGVSRDTSGTDSCPMTPMMTVEESSWTGNIAKNIIFKIKHIFRFLFPSCCVCRCSKNPFLNDKN